MNCQVIQYRTQYQLDQLKKSDTNNTTTEESGTQIVSLPGYELYNTLPSNVPVDAEWKVSYLKELDAQLSMRKSKEENDKIINQMDTILHPRREEYLSKQICIYSLTTIETIEDN